MHYLSISDYEAREQTAADELPNRVVEMVNPVIFASEGYPMRVRHERVLWRYLDVMHETRFEQDFKLLHEGGLTPAEFTRLKNVATLARDFALAHFERPLTTRGSLSRALHVHRAITDIAGEKPARLFEIGPGSGYLGCLFIQSGWAYGATDITQAFYLLQNRLWQNASAGQLRELATHPDWDHQLHTHSPVHIPWWEFFRLIENRPPAADIVTCNHALAEMHPNSLAFTLRLARDILSGPGQKLFIFEGWGYEKLTSRQKVFEQFVKFGFNLVHADDHVTVFAPHTALQDPSAGILPNGQIHNHTQDSAKRIFLPFNTLTPRILSARAARLKLQLHQPPEINDFYTQLLNTTDHRTADERFLDLIDKNYH